MMAYETVWEFYAKWIGKTVYTDHQVFNFINSGARYFNYKDNVESQRCYGLKDIHGHVFDYAQQFIENYAENNRFLYLHSSAAHELSGSVIKTMDPDLKILLENLFQKYENIDEDLVVMIGNDHGIYKRESGDLGWLEQVLPGNFIFTKKSMINRMGPETDKILKFNTKVISSRFDWYLTLRNIALIPYGNLKTNSEIYRA